MVMISSGEKIFAFNLRELQIGMKVVASGEKDLTA
jgi:hypothetical protein